MKWHCNHKYKAFTITEAIFGLIISSIIISAVYYAFNAFNKQFYMYQNAQEVTNEYLLLDTTLKRDVYYSNELVFSENQVFLNDYQNNKVTYTFYNDYISRTVEDVETNFKVDLVTYALKKGNKKHSITLTIVLQGEKTTFRYVKDVNNAAQINTIFASEDRK